MGTNTLKLTGLVIPLAMLFVLSACADREGVGTDGSDTLAADTSDAAAGAAGSIYEVLQRDGRFGRLITAVDSAGLGETLSGPEPFTVFAPNDAAFEAMEDGTLDELLSNENRNQLRGLLLYHIAGDRLMTEDLQAGAVVRTLEGSDLSVNGSGDSLTVGGARVTDPGIATENGVIHVIDRVLVPGSSDGGV